MKQQDHFFETALYSTSVETVSGQLKDFLERQKAEHREILRCVLTVEDILLDELERLGEGTPVRLKTGVHFFRPCFSLEIDGTEHNVFSSSLEKNGAYGASILKNLGLSPEYSYKNHTNIYSLRLKKKSVNPFITLSVALAAALLTGFLGRMLSENARAAVLDNVLAPLNTAFLNILGCVAGPMIFLSVAWGIYGIGDAASLKNIGKKILKTYGGLVFLASCVGGLVCIPFFRLRFTSGSEGANGVSAVLSMLLNIVPKNIVSPFADGNTLQIIFLAVAAGIVLIVLGQKTAAIANAMGQINTIFQHIIEVVSKCIPVFIFIVLVSMIWSDSAAILLKVGKLFGVFLLGLLLFLAVLITITAVKLRANPFLLIKKGLPVFIIGLTTASSAATFASNLKACKTEYGLEENLTAFGLPLGMVLFKPNTAISFCVISMCFAEMYGMEISPGWIVIMLFSVCVLSMATPPIPGGALTTYTVLFAQLGIPAEALAIALACDTVFDFILTGTDQFELPFALLNQTNKPGRVNKDILRRKTEKKR